MDSKLTMKIMYLKNLDIYGMYVCMYTQYTSKQVFEIITIHV